MNAVLFSVLRNRADCTANDSSEREETKGEQCHQQRDAMFTNVKVTHYDIPPFFPPPRAARDEADRKRKIPRRKRKAGAGRRAGRARSAQWKKRASGRTPTTSEQKLACEGVYATRRTVRKKVARAWPRHASRRKNDGHVHPTSATVPLQLKHSKPPPLAGVPPFPCNVPLPRHPDSPFGFSLSNHHTYPLLSLYDDVFLVCLSSAIEARLFYSFPFTCAVLPICLSLCPRVCVRACLYTRLPTLSPPFISPSDLCVTMLKRDQLIFS